MLRVVVWFLAGVLAWALPAGGEEPVRIRTATLAPEGSTWMTHYTEMAEEVKQRTQGRVEFVFYPGGVVGDENLVVKKLRIGQVQAAMLSGVGLSEILPEVRILDIPFLYRTHEETDRVRALVQPRFEQGLAAKGFVALGWSDLGTLYIMSQQPLRTVADLRRRRVWVWQGDTVAETTFRTCGVNPVPIAVPDVLTSLRTGLLDTVYVSPVASIALQWFSAVNTMTDLPLLDAFCLLLVTEKQLARVSAEDRKAVLEVNRAMAVRLTAETRRQDVESIKTLREKGIQVVPPDASTRAELDGIARDVSRKLVGTLYGQELLDEVLKTLDRKTD